MNLISYSLYGCAIRYTDPLIWNSKNLNSFYKGWIMRVYHDDSVPSSVLKTLSENGVHLINIKDTMFSYFAPKFWRFLPVFENHIEALLVRDSDSIFSNREVFLVNEWFNSKFQFHILRDHQLHISPILAGMFGLKKSLFSIFSKQLNTRLSLVCSNSYNADQVFLGDYVYSKVIMETIIHTSHFSFYGEKFIQIEKCEKPNGFIGSVFLGSDSTNNSNQDYKFIIGIPFWLSKFLRYRIRLVLYFSLVFYFFLLFFKRSKG